MKNVIILGASGSIGQQTCEVIKENPNDFTLVGVSVGHNISCLEDIISSFPSIKYACVQEEKDYLILKNKYKNISFYCKDEGILELIDECESNLVVNALVGFVGFLPSYHTLKKGINLALANKESLVVGGSLLFKLTKETNAKIFAIDSEHCALDKCLKNQDLSTVKNLVITASGGSFRDYKKEDLAFVTVKDALKHPSWSMGNKITIDSATMMNKGFEIIEAMHLFNFPLERIKVLLHDESIIHSLVEFNDYSFKADIGPTSMKIAISYALYENNINIVKVKPLSLEEIGSLHFRKLDESFYPCLSLAYKAIRMGGTATCVLNRVNEEAVHSFLRNEISYLDISKVIDYVLSQHNQIINPTLDDILSADKWAKDKSIEILRRIKKC